MGQADNWFNDAQRIMSMIIIMLFVGLMGMNAYAMFKAASINDIVEMQKQLNNALINIVMVVVGFYFGSSKSSQAKDETQAKVAEKLAEKVPAGPADPGMVAAAVAAAAPAAAAVAAPPAAAEAAPPAVDAELDRRGVPDNTKGG